ncbi:MAG: hypothetical protein IJ002_06840 [Clostridia bacterium]|nr:hypothetical protein [Clostridia bacterium]
MKRRIPISGRIIALNVLFTLFVPIIVLGIYTLATKQILMEDGTPMPSAFKYVMIALCLIIGLGIFNMVIRIWARVFTGRGAMTLTECGIEDTFVIFSVLAFWTTLDIKFIPWDAVGLTPDISGALRIDTAKLPRGSTGKMTRLILRFGGFNAGVGKIKTEELLAIKCTAPMDGVTL